MANIIISRTANLDRPGNTEFLSGTLFADENLAHTFAISATRNGAEIALSGVVTACFIRPDGGTVELNGTIEDGKACVTLAESCYVVTGRFKLTVFVSVDGAKTAVYCAAGNVVETTTNTIIDPGSVVPSVDDIIAEYATMQQAVEDCEDAAEAANTAASAADTAAANVAGAIADAYSATGTYAVGDYCTKDGKLYRCVSAISTAEAWTAAHWAEVTAMGEVVEITGALSDKLQGVVDNQIIETTEAAAFAYIPDAARAAAKGVDITIKPAQAGSGDPSPTNIRPISGWTAVKLGRAGKNMLPKMVAGTYTERGVTVTVNADGVATLSGTATSTGNGPIVPLEEEFVIPKAGLVYCLNNSVANANISPTIERSAGGGINLSYTLSPANRQVTLAEGKVGMSCARIRFYVSNGAVASGTFAPAIMAEAGSYEPNDGENSLQTIALPEEAGTVYGGTLHINEDGSGVLTVDRAMYDLAEITSGWYTATINGLAVVRRRVSDILGETGDINSVLCSHFKNAAAHTSASVAENTVINLAVNYYNLTLCAPSLFTTVEELNTWTAAQKTNGTPVQLSYKISTPTTYNLTAEQVALLKGANVIYADAGDTAVEYVADTKAYIDNKIAELQALILENI